MAKSKKSSKTKSSKPSILKASQSTKTVKNCVNKKTIPLIHALSKLPDDHFHTVVKFLNKDGVEALCECVFNCLYNHNHKDISKEKKLEVQSRLRANRKVYEYLAKARNSIKGKRKLLQKSQTGQGLGVILATVLPILLSQLLPK